MSNRESAGARTLSDPDRSRLFVDHLRRCDAMAAKFNGRGLAPDDCKQVANVALWEATDQFDPLGHPGVPFWGFARILVRRAIIAAIREARAHGIAQAPGDVSFSSIDPDLLHERAFNSSDVADAVWLALTKMGPVQQKVLIRRTGIDGDRPWTIIECASEMGLSVAQVKRCLAQGRVEIGTELYRAGWDPRRWAKPQPAESHIQVG